MPEGSAHGGGVVMALSVPGWLAGCPNRRLGETADRSYTVEGGQRPCCMSLLHKQTGYYEGGVGEWDGGQVTPASKLSNAQQWHLRLKKIRGAAAPWYVKGPAWRLAESQIILEQQGMCACML